MGKFVTRNARELHDAGDAEGAAFVRTTAGLPNGPMRLDFSKADNSSGVSVRDTPTTTVQKEAKKSFGINGQLDTIDARLGRIREKLNVIVESRKFSVQKSAGGLNDDDAEDMLKAARAKGKRIGVPAGGPWTEADEAALAESKRAKKN